MTRADIERIEAIAAAASPGPWTAHHSDPRVRGVPRMTRKGDGIPKPVPDSEARIVALGDDGGCSDPDCCGGATYHVELRAEDAAFIAAARAAVPALVAELLEAIELLRRVEFGQHDDHGLPLCPMCWRTRPGTNIINAATGAHVKSEGHAPDCALAALLRRYA